MTGASSAPFTRIRTVWCVLITGVPITLAVLTWGLTTRPHPSRPAPPTDIGDNHYNVNDTVSTTCNSQEDSTHSFRHECSHGNFSLPRKTKCRPWLKCDDIESDDFTIGRELGRGVVKVARLSRWKGHDVVHIRVRSETYTGDFKRGLHTLIGLQPSMYVTQLLGYCNNRFVTEYHSLGTAANIHKVLSRAKFKAYNTLNTRFGLCMRYVEVLAYLHNGPTGPRIMCDSNSLQKTLSQFLLTEDLTLVVNDVDALPIVIDGRGIKCGSRQLFGQFVAPEQRWPHDKRDFIDSEMPSYDEKTDVWKIPDVCNFFVKDFPGGDALRLHLFKVHAQCKRKKAAKRPSSNDILEQYRSIATRLQLV